MKGRDSELLIGICILIYSHHVKRRNMVLMAPRFSRAQSVHSVCLRSGKATFVSCASALAGVQKSSFVALGSRKCAQRCAKPKSPALTCSDLPSGLHPQHNAVIKNRYTRNDPVPHQLGHAAVTALMRNSSFFFSSSQTWLCAQEKGGPAIPLLASLPNNPLGTTSRIPLHLSAPFVSSGAFKGTGGG